MPPTAPTVSVEVGNFGDSSDLARFLGGPEHFGRIATGIALHAVRCGVYVPTTFQVGGCGLGQYRGAYGRGRGLGL
jgi:hypothetical protein